MAICMKTPFSYVTIMDVLYNNAQDAFEDARVRPHDMHARMRTINATLVLLYTTMTCEFLTQCAHLIPLVSQLEQEFIKWCSESKIEFDLANHMISGEKQGAIVLECGENECLQFGVICNRYHFVPLMPFESDCKSHETPHSVTLPWLDGAVRATLKSSLQSMYTDHIQRCVHLAIQKGALRCRIPCMLFDWLTLGLMLAQDNNWEDAVLFLWMSSDQNTLSMLLKLWPCESKSSEIHERKLLNMRWLLETPFPITDIDGVVHALHNDYLAIFYRVWACKHMPDFLLTVRIHSLDQLRELYDIMELQNHVFVRFAIPRLLQTTTDFKDMILFLWQLPDKKLKTADLQTMLALDPNTVQNLLTI